MIPSAWKYGSPKAKRWFRMIFYPRRYKLYRHTRNHLPKTVRVGFTHLPIIPAVRMEFAAIIRIVGFHFDFNDNFLCYSSNACQSSSFSTNLLSSPHKRSQRWNIYVAVHGIRNKICVHFPRKNFILDISLNGWSCTTISRTLSIDSCTRNPACSPNLPFAGPKTKQECSIILNVGHFSRDDMVPS